METVIIVIHLMVVASLIALVLLQRSEGGALGIGGGSSFMAARGQGNVLTRVTAYLAAGFFATSIVLTVLARLDGGGSVLDNLNVNSGEGLPVEDRPQGGGLLDILGGFPGAETPADVPDDAGGAVNLVPADGAVDVPDDAGGAAVDAAPAPVDVPDDAGAEPAAGQPAADEPAPVVPDDQ
ncbi:MAG: preprotein translocase subunit SecG [Bauldia sp.]|nr:preprotein translocase subunit SecG [Bauldia sp.]